MSLEKAAIDYTQAVEHLEYLKENGFGTQTMNNLLETQKKVIARKYRTLRKAAYNHMEKEAIKEFLKD
jgi:hypothetical protein